MLVGLGHDVVGIDSASTAPLPYQLVEAVRSSDYSSRYLWFGLPKKTILLSNTTAIAMDGKI